MNFGKVRNPFQLYQNLKQNWIESVVKVYTDDCPFLYVSIATLGSCWGRGWTACGISISTHEPARKGLSKGV